MISFSFWTRSPRSTPVTSACRCGRSVMVEKSVTIGLFKLGSLGKLHAPTVRAPNASARYVILMAFLPCRGMGVRVWSRGAISEVHREREEEAAGRRIGREILAAIDVLVAEVRDLGVEALVRRPSDQVAAAQLWAHSPHVAAEQGAHEVVGQLIRQDHLPQLQEGGILDVDRLARSRGMEGGEPCLGGGRVRGDPVLVEYVLRDVHDVATVPPIEQPVELEVLERDLAREPHGELGLIVAHLGEPAFAVTPVDLRRGGPLFDEPGSVRKAEV